MSSSANAAISTAFSKVVLLAFMIVKLLAFTVSLKVTVPAWVIVTDGAVAVVEAVEPTAPVTVIVFVALFGTLKEIV